MNNYNRLWKVRVIFDALFILLVSFFPAPPVSPPPSSHPVTTSHPPELPGVSLGWPGPFRPASDLHEQVCQLVWHHAPGPLSDEAGSGPLQRPGVHTAEEVQGHREAITLQSPPAPWTRQRQSEGADTERNSEPLHDCMDGSMEERMRLGTGRERRRRKQNKGGGIGLLGCVLLHFSFPPFLFSVFGDCPATLWPSSNWRTSEDLKTARLWGGGQSHRVGNQSLLLQCPNSGKSLPAPALPAEKDCLSHSVHSAQVPESFWWQNIIDNYDYEEDNTILDCV